MNERLLDFDDIFEILMKMERKYFILSFLGYKIAKQNTFGDFLIMHPFKNVNTLGFGMS